MKDPTSKSSGGTPPEGGSPEQSNWEVILRLLKFTWRYRGRCVQVIILQLILLIMGMSGLALTGLAIDFLAYRSGDSTVVPEWPFGLVPPPDMGPLTVVACISLGILGFAMFRAVMNYSYSIAVTRLVHTELVVDLRDEVYQKLQRLSFRFFDEHASGSIINRVTSDVQSLRMFVDGAVIQSFIMVLSLTVYLIYMLNIHVTLTLACLATTPLLWLAAARFSSISRPMHKRSRELMDDLVLSFSERIQGINMVKGFALEEEALRGFKESNANVREQRETLFWVTSFYGPLISFLPQINIFILLLYGGWLVIQGDIAIGTGIVVFAGLLQQFSGQITNIAGVVDSIQQSLTGARRVFEILDSPVEVDNRPDSQPLKRAEGRVVFENVWFKYKVNDTVLENINFTVEPGEVVAIAGATGSGKSALMSLIPRFYDPTEGRILVDGRNVRDYKIEDLRRNIGLVFQENFLFSNTIAANIAYGNAHATREQIEKAARIAAAHEFIMEMSEGYDTLLGESGVNLSGGQRQRLAIARAILLEPAILILDDPTAAIDPETEHEILEAIENAIVGRTTFIVAHRMSTLRRADRVIVLKKGRIVQTGHHNELAEQPGPYRKAISIQQVDAESLALLTEADNRRRANGSFLR